MKHTCNARAWAQMAPAQCKRCAQLLKASDVLDAMFARTAPPAAPALPVRPPHVRTYASLFVLRGGKR